MAISLQSGKAPASTASLYLLGVLFAVAGFYAISHDQLPLLFSSLALTPLLVAYTLDRRLGIYLAFCYLIPLGDLRRIEGWVLGFPSNDPLLVVGPLFAILAAAPIFLRIRLSDLPSKLGFALLVMMILQIFNPAQGGLAVGVSGAMISIPPLLWFWLGRYFGNPKLVRGVCYRIVVPFGTLAACLGYYQVFIGFAPWEDAWIAHVSHLYSSLYIGGYHSRAFGFSTSSSEYQNLMLLAIVISFAGLMAGRRLMAIPCIMIFPGIILASSRTTIVRVLFGFAIAYAFKSSRRGTQTFRFGVGFMIGISALALVASQYSDFHAPRGGKGTQADYAIAHEVGGLTDPLHSTASLHSQEIQLGILQAFLHPIGFGVGASNIAAAKFGGNGVGTEFDLSDQFLELGVLGGFIYLAFVITMIRGAFRYTRVGAKDASLPIAALLPAVVGDWLFPGEWGNGPLLFLLIGCMVHEMYPLPVVKRVLNRGRAGLVRTTAGFQAPEVTGNLLPPSGAGA